MNSDYLLNSFDPLSKLTRSSILLLSSIIGTMLLIVTTAILVSATTVSKTNTTDGFADGNEITRTVTISTADFSSGARISNVTISVEFEKVDTSCGNYDSGSVFNREPYIVLQSPAGTNVVLIENVFNDGGSGHGSTYFSNTAYNGIVTIDFDDSAATQVRGQAPESGTFRPEQFLSAFNGEDPVGDWILTLGDSTTGAPLCFYETSLTIEADQPPVMDDQSFTVPENSPNGTMVDTVVVTDEDPGEKFTFAEIGGSGAAVFEIDSASGVISVTDGTQLDFETPAMAQYTYIVEVTDSGALTDTATITIDVTDSNDPPSDLTLSSASVLEHQPVGTAVGTLSSVDQDSGDSHQYQLVAGVGDDDNSDFTIVGDELQTSASFDYETKNSYSIRVESDDRNGGTFEKSLIISIIDGNDPPTDITLDSTTVEENEPISTTVGTLTVTDPNSDPASFTLVSGVGDDDNAQFNIVGQALQTAATFDFEAGPTSFNIRIKADDGNGGTFEKTFVITVVDADDAATDFSLSNNTLAENSASGTAVGTFTAVDVDTGTYTYTLASGTGDTDNGSFQIIGDELQSAAVFDYETQNSFSIRTQLDDGITTIQKVFTITVTNANEAPTDIGLAPTTVLEHQPTGTTVGTLTTTDPDVGNSHTYTLVSGVGADDNASFQISGDSVQTKVELDYDTKITHTVRIQTNDGLGGLFEKAVEIVVLDGNDPPTDISLDNATVLENQASGTSVGNLSGTDPNGDSPLTFTLPNGLSDNADFQISGSELQTAVSFDYETQNSYNIVVQVDDGNGGTYQKPFVIAITDDNDAPTSIHISSTTVLENEPSNTLVGILSAADQDDLVHTFSLVSGSGDTDNGLFTISGTELQTLTVFDYETNPGPYSIRVEAVDSGSAAISQTLTISILDSNDDPFGITIDDPTFDENMPFGSEVGVLTTLDQDSSDIHTYSLVAGAGDDHNHLFTLTDEILETNSAFNFEADPLTYTVRLQSDDGIGNPVSQIFTLTLVNTNDVPVAVPDFGGTIDEDTVLTVLPAAGVLLNDTDEDVGDVLSVLSFDSLSADMAIVSGAPDGGFSYDPSNSQLAQALKASESRVDSFTYIVQDAGGLTATTTVTIVVTGVNDDPTAGADSVFTPEETAVTINLLDNDTDPESDTLTISNLTQPGVGTLVDHGDGSVTYTPPNGYRGQQMFTYTVEDGNGGSDSATVTISVGQVKVFLPVMINNLSLAPDLVVTHIDASADEINVVIKNQGRLPTETGFWVDLYIAPDPVPTEVGQEWSDVADEGIVWGVTEPIGPGESLELTYSTNMGAPNLYYSAINSSYSGILLAGTPLYAQVDSAHLNSSFGGVVESHELYGQLYNNISQMFEAND